METLAGFLGGLFGEGRVVFRGPPTGAASGADRAEAAGMLRGAFAEELMELAGPPLAFDEGAALAAAEWTRRACWFLVGRGEPPEAVERALTPPRAPGSPAAHLAADLTFRYLPAVHRRARAIDPGDVLSTRLAEVLRGWPLSGAGSDVEEGPTAPIDFGGHEGLLLRFAERLAGRPRPAWTPAGGPALEFLAMALDAIGGERTYSSGGEIGVGGRPPRGGPEAGAIGGTGRGPA